MRLSEILFALLLALAIVGMVFALITGKQRGRFGMYNEGCVIGRVVEVVPATEPKRPDILLLQDLARPEYPTLVAAEFFGDKTRVLLGKAGTGELVRVVGSIQSHRSKAGGVFTHFAAFSLQSLPAYAQAQAVARGFKHREDLPF